MGATGFDHIVRGENTLDKAFNQARNQALEEHGSDPYSGTIATVSGAQAITHRPMDIHEAYKVVDRYWNHEEEYPFISKWGDCGAIPLLKDSGSEAVKRSKKVTLDAVEFAAFQRGNNDAVKSYLKPLKGHIITDVRVIDSDISTKVETKATEGERETRYLVDGMGVNPHNRWDTGFSSQAEARAWADQQAKEANVRIYDASQQWGIYAVTRRADGSPLVVSKRIVKRAVLDVEYTMVRPTTSSKQDGWMFFGWAAC